MRNKLIATGALTAVAVLAPAGAASAHIGVGVKSVKAHTDRADRALDRAVRLFERNADKRGSRSLTRSRREIGKATAEAAKLRRRARTPRRRAAAARAAALVGDQKDENVDQLVGLLDEVAGRVENKVAKAALSDTRGREKAIAVITALLERGVPEQAVKGLTRALAALALDRDDEVRQEVEALIGNDVARRGKRTVVRTVKVNVAGQTTASEKLAELIASEEMPAQSKPGLLRAYAAVTGERGEVVDILSRLSDRMPGFVRPFVEQIITQARTSPTGMRENRPAPPTGGPTGFGPGSHPGPGGPFAG